MSHNPRKRLASGCSEPAKRFKSSQKENLSQLEQEASTCEGLNLWRAGFELRLKISKLYKETHGEEDFQTLTAIHLLADAYAKLGRLDEASEEYRQAMLGRERGLGETHLDTIQSTLCLAETYYKQDQLAEAIPLYEKSAQGFERALGPDDPRTLGGIHQLAFCCLEAGQLKRAESLYLLILPKYRQAFGPADAETTSVTRKLSTVYQKQDRWNQAKLLETELLETLKQTFGDSHPDTVATMESLVDLDRQERRHQGNDVPSSPIAESSNREADTTTSVFISASTPIEEALMYLANHGCPDITGKLNLSQSSQGALSGGTFGYVWGGMLRDQTRVAIKCLRLHTNIEANRKNTKRGARELYHWSKLKHQNVLELLGVALFQGQLSMVSPWMANGTLQEYIAKNRHVDRWGLSLQVAAGLTYIHQQGMVHGDLKAMNILVSDDGIAKIADFGSSVMLNYSLAFSASRHPSGGTTRWMGPELFEDDAGGVITSMQADVYALGMTILEILTGEVPYSKYQREGRVVLAVVRGSPPERSAKIFPNTKYGEEQWGLLLSCWRMEANHRPKAYTVETQLRRLSAVITNIPGADYNARCTSLDMALRLVIGLGCLEVTRKLDLSQCSTAAIAKGSFVDVWLGTLTDDTKVAIKCPLSRVFVGAKVKHVKRAGQEFYNWSKSKHRNVLEMVGIAVFRNQLAIISPWMENGNLVSYVQNNQNLNRWALCLQVTEGLAYMHSIGLVHGNLMGSNILVSSEGTVKIGGFGSSIWEHSSLVLSDIGVVGVAARWMAPELFMEPDEEDLVDNSMPADVYALGMTILEVFTGRLPYSELKTVSGVIKAVVSGRRPRQPAEFASSTKHGDARWNMLNSCWDMNIGLRPTAREVGEKARALS